MKLIFDYLESCNPEQPWLSFVLLSNVSINNTTQVFESFDLSMVDSSKIKSSGKESTMLSIMF